MKACVVGLGKAGLPLAAVMADAGIEVIGYDLDKKRVAEINSGENPLPEEDGLAELLKKHGGKKLKATTDIKDAKDAKAYIVLVPLFLDSKNKPDMSILTAAFKQVASVLSDGDLVVLETTVPPGTTQTIVKKILDKSGKKYLLAYSPERIMTGYSISRFRQFPKVVGGIDEQSTKAAQQLYTIFSKNVVPVRDAKTAEMVKVAEGVFRDVNISLANELYMVCEKAGVDFWQMRQAASHTFCNIHEPGMVGGHCIPVYPWFLINNYDVPLIRLARKLNEKMIDYYADKAAKIAGKKGKIGIVGLSYRAGVKETSHTKAHALIRKLKKRGLSVWGLDPLLTAEEVEQHFKIPHLHDPSKMDAFILTDKIAGANLPAEKTVDLKNALTKN